ncbi:signal recognition particle-docking protein FtsY [Sulfuracidifex tepidarius]|uniref:signal recognition particle-docking protein FtsY n=1 Tax=Sulfuracidifex tepidarius TaxID=1294262 RepID=UPI0006D11176|nr:signal recognition particle-docking protein FtsY [Sulfuracidifex tepidarius]
MTGTERKDEKKRTGFFDIFRYKEIKEKDVEDLIEELRYQLLESDVTYEVTEKLLDDIKKAIVGKKIRRSEDLEQTVMDTLKKSIEEILTKNENIDIIKIIKESQRPFVIVFFGVNGVGKTTTIAKFIYMLKKNGLTCIVSASDTFRAAAQEQLAIHAQKLEVPMVKGKYGGDPAAVAFDAIQSAKSRNIDVVLVDTAGRMNTDADLTNELRRVMKIAKPNFKILVLDSLGGNDTLEQAKYFENAIGFDAVILTKVDADAKGGVVLSLAYELKKPVIFLGVGQEYENLEPFSAQWFIDRLFSS